jgi:hypothetical protein
VDFDYECFARLVKRECVKFLTTAAKVTFATKTNDAEWGFLERHVLLFDNDHQCLCPPDLEPRLKRFPLPERQPAVSRCAHPAEGHPEGRDVRRPKAIPKAGIPAEGRDVPLGSI